MYRAQNKSLQILLNRTQARPEGRLSEGDVDLELDVDFQAHAVLEYDDIAVRDEGNLDLELDFTVEKGDQKELPLTYSFCARFGARFNYRNPSKSSSKSNMRSNFMKIIKISIV